VLSNEKQNTRQTTQSFVFPAFLSWEVRFRHFSLGFFIKHWILFRKLYYSPKLIKNAETQRALKLSSSIYRALVYYKLGLDKPRWVLSKKSMNSLDTLGTMVQQVVCRVISKLH
jgi:hypothetical protein